MEAFYDDRLSRFQGNRRIIEIAFTGDEVKTSQLHGLALIEGIDLLIE